MSSFPLSNHLRPHRRRLSLSQGEIAFLLGIKSESVVCRNERFVRNPNLEAVIAYEAIFQKSARELFKGLYKQIERKVAGRAQQLLNEKHDHKSNPLSAHKRQILANIVANQTDNSSTQHEINTQDGRSHTCHCSE